MIELLWIAIAALGCWNVYHHAKQNWYETIQRLATALEIETGNRENSDEQLEKLRDRLEAEVERREALEEMIGKYMKEPQPVMLNMPVIYRAMCAIAASETDPDSIIRQAEGKDWEGGCGDHH